MNKNSIFSLVIILFFYINNSDSCSCSQLHPQTHYCGAEYVIIGNVSEIIMPKNRSEAAVSFKITDIFKKGPGVGNALESGMIYMSDPFCYAYVEIGKQYIVVGRIGENGRATFSACNYVKKWDTVTPYQRSKFEFLYDCKCTIDNCTSSYCNSNNNSCHMSESKSHCYHSFSSCQPDPNNGKCDWVKNAQFDKCMKK